MEVHISVKMDAGDFDLSKLEFNSAVFIYSGSAKKLGNTLT